MKNKTLNHKVITEPYKGERKIQSQVSKGFASVKQKNTIVALKVLADAHISDNIVIKEGSYINVNEEVLFSKLSTQKPLESTAISEPFVLIDFNDIIFISEE